MCSPDLLAWCRPLRLLVVCRVLKYGIYVGSVNTVAEGEAFQFPIPFPYPVSKCYESSDPVLYLYFAFVRGSLHSKSSVSFELT